MKNILKNMSSFKNSSVIQLGYGTIISNLVSFLVQPIITRIITPEQLGIYNTVISIANLIIPIASLKLFQLIVVSNEEEETNKLVQISINTVIMMSILCIIFVVISLLLNNTLISNLGIQAYLIPLIVLTNGLYFVMISYFNNLKRYQYIARSDISKEGTRSLLQVAFGLLGMLSFGQSLAHVFSTIPALLVAAKKYFHTIYQNNRINFFETFISYKKYKNQIIYLVPGQFINTFSYTIILLSIQSLYSADKAGYYSISMKILGVPLLLVSENISRIYLKKMSELINLKRNYLNFFLKLIGIMFLISIVGFTILALIAPSFSEIIFGNGYYEAGKYISILCIMFMVRFVVSSVNSTFVIFNKQYRDVLFQILLCMGGGIAYILSNYFEWEIYEYLWLISLTYGFIYIIILGNIGFLIYKSSIGDKHD